MAAAYEAMTPEQLDIELFYASKNGNFDTVNDLLAAGADTEVTDARKNTPLLVASWNGYTAVVERLLAAGADTGATDVDRSTPLCNASWNGHTAIVERLLDAGADTEAANIIGRRPLFMASWKGHTAIVERLLAAGANVNAATNDKTTPLLAAATNGHTAIVERLLAAGADTEAADAYNRETPLIPAARKGHTAIVDRLLAAGANTDAANRDRQTALFVASEYGHIAIVERLLAAGANTEVADREDRNTPLLVAAREGHTAVVERLLAAGADRKKRSYERKTAIDIARERGYLEIVRLLERADVADAAAAPLQPTRNVEYETLPSVHDIMEAEDKPFVDVNNSDNVIFKHGPTFFVYSKANLQMLNDHSRIVFECKERLVGGAPRRTQIHEDRPYFSLPGPGMNYLIPHMELLTTINHSEFHTFELVQSGELANTASYGAVMVDPTTGRGLDGQEVTLVGMDHCTDGTNKPVFHVHPLRIRQQVAQEGGRGRRTRTQKAHRPRSARRRRHAGGRQRTRRNSK